MLWSGLVWYAKIARVKWCHAFDRRTDGWKVERRAIFCWGRIRFRNIDTIITKTETRVTVPQ